MVEGFNLELFSNCGRTRVIDGGRGRISVRPKRCVVVCSDDRSRESGKNNPTNPNAHEPPIAYAKSCTPTGQDDHPSFEGSGRFYNASMLAAATLPGKHSGYGRTRSRKSGSAKSASLPRAYATGNRGVNHRGSAYGYALIGDDLERVKDATRELLAALSDSRWVLVNWPDERH
jgi:hypothetical protein